MKITKKSLKQIIKEELEAVINENSENDDVKKAAEEMADSPAMQTIYVKMAKDPEVLKALEQIKSEMNEEVLGMTKDSGAGATAMGTFLSVPSAGIFMGSSAGKLLMAKAAVAMGVSAATLGTAAVGLLAPIALGFVIDVVKNKASKR